MRILRKTGAGAGGRRGGVLVLSLIAVFTVTILAASFSQFASSVANRQAQAVNKKRAFYVAEAGLAEAFAGFTCGRDGAVGSAEHPAILGDGVFWVEATELEPDVVRLVSTGMIASGRAELALIVHRGELDVRSLGVFANGDLTLPAGSLLDAYDSSKKAYELTANRSGACLGSNGGIALSGLDLTPITIDGDVTAGPDQEVLSVGLVNVTGATSSAFQATELPQVDLPELALEPTVTHDSPYPLVITPGTSGYEGLQVTPGSQVIIQGPAKVVLGSLALAAEAELNFDTTQGKVELFVTDALALSSGSLLTTTSGDPEDVLIQVPGETEQPLSLRSSGSFHGVIYAPDASVEVGADFELFGALVADVMNFDGPANIHYDKHLAALAAEASLPKVMSWRLEELAASSQDLAADPFSILGVDRSTLLDPSASHVDQILTIDYYDFSDVYHRYSGPESAFDWNVVKTVIFALRDGVEVLFPRSTSLRSGAIKAPGVLPVIDGPMI